MKLACTQENLQRGLSIVGRTVSRSSTLPVLGNVLLKTDTGGLRLTATDLELGVSCIVGGKVEEKGELTVPARLLADYVGQLPKEKVSLAAEGKSLKLNCEERHAQINGIAAEEFPLIPTFETNFSAELPGLALREAIRKVVFAVANDESRPELAGVFVQFEKGRCTLAATDSFRLAEVSLQAEGTKDSKSMIVPSKTLAELARIIDDESAVSVRASDNQLLLTYRDVELTSRLIEGQYPPYRDIVPNDLATRATLDRGEFLDAVRAAGLFSKTGASDVKIAVDPEHKQLRLQAEASQVGGHEQVLSAAIDGPADNVVFNYRYLLEGLSALGGARVLFETGGSSSPGKLTSLSKDDASYVYILMPIKL
ncbi:MAG: DNA polymerase III subunit beta [Candidatus Andersenbacteria bacterium]